MKRLLILSASVILLFVFYFTSCSYFDDYSADVRVVNFVDSEITVEVDGISKDIPGPGGASWTIRWNGSETEIVTLWSIEYFRTITVSDGENHIFYRYNTGWEYTPPYN